MKTNGLSERLVNYDILRILAAYLIVMLHLSVQYINKAPASVDEYLQWQQAIKLSTFSRVGVPIFIMLSGAFLLNPNKKVSLNSIFRKYLPKLLLIFMFWSLFYSLAEQDFWKNVFNIGFSNSFSIIDWNDFWIDFVQGHYHMWYLYMLAGLYLLTPLIKHISEHASKQQLTYFTLMCLVVTSVTKLNEELWKLPLLETIMQKMALSFFFGYIGYFIGGYLISKYTPCRITTVIVFALGLLSFKFTYEQTWLLNPMFGFETPNLVFFSNYSPTVFLMSFAIFLLFAKLGNLKVPLFYKLKETLFFKGLKVFICRLPQYMLVVYLVHPFILVQCRALGILYPTDTAWTLPLNALIVYVVSLVIGFILIEAYKLVFRIVRC
ncbi:MAG: acyltransferase [Aminipila sp.]